MVSAYAILKPTISSPVGLVFAAIPLLHLQARQACAVALPLQQHRGHYRLSHALSTLIRLL